MFPFCGTAYAPCGGQKLYLTYGTKAGAMVAQVALQSDIWHRYNFYHVWKMAKGSQKVKVEYRCGLVHFLFCSQDIEVFPMLRSALPHKKDNPSKQSILALLFCGTRSKCAEPCLHFACASPTNGADRLSAGQFYRCGKNKICARSKIAMIRMYPAH